jgi:transcriptional regulator CtsR
VTVVEAELIKQTQATDKLIGRTRALEAAAAEAEGREQAAKAEAAFSLEELSKREDQLMKAVLRGKHLHTMKTRAEAEAEEMKACLVSMELIGRTQATDELIGWTQALEAAAAEAKGREQVAEAKAAVSLEELSKRRDQLVKAVLKGKQLHTMKKQAEAEAEEVKARLVSMELIARTQATDELIGRTRALEVVAAAAVNVEGKHAAEEMERQLRERAAATEEVQRQLQVTLNAKP